MKKIIFLGPPGAGKGTQAQALASSYQIPHISTGEILRQAIAEKTTLGQKAQSYVDAGELVPDDLILDLIGERLNRVDASVGWILDGFPRNVSQAEFLSILLAQLNQVPDYAINLEVPDEILVARLLSRGRKDDNEDTIRRRLEVYRQQTAPVIDFYRQNHLLESVNGDFSMAEVTKAIQTVVDG